MFQKLAEVTYDYSTSSDYGTSSPLSSAIVLIVLLLVFALVIVMFVAQWKVYVKAGKPGWATLVPFYNLYVLCEIVGRPGWWFVLMLVPYVNFIIFLLIAIDLAKAFGKSTAFGVVALWLFSPVGYLMLGFGDATYQGAAPTDISSTTATAVPAAPTAPAAPVAPTAPASPTTPTKKQ